MSAILRIDDCLELSVSAIIALADRCAIDVRQFCPVWIGWRASAGVVLRFSEGFREEFRAPHVMP
jgi:hypothetical protein